MSTSGLHMHMQESVLVCTRMKRKIFDAKDSKYQMSRELIHLTNVYHMHSICEAPKMLDMSF